MKTSPAKRTRAIEALRKHGAGAVVGTPDAAGLSRATLYRLESQDEHRRVAGAAALLIAADVFTADAATYLPMLLRGLSAAERRALLGWFREGYDQLPQDQRTRHAATIGRLTLMLARKDSR